MNKFGSLNNFLNGTNYYFWMVCNVFVNYAKISYMAYTLTCLFFKPLLILLNLQLLLVAREFSNILCRTDWLEYMPATHSLTSFESFNLQWLKQPLFYIRESAAQYYQPNGILVLATRRLFKICFSHPL